MKANELRIGNLVLIPSHANKNIPLIPCIEKKILGITKFGELDFTEPTYPEPHLVHYNHCSGIPLTEEWLLKFGFEKDGFDFIIKLHFGTELTLNFGNNVHAVIQDNEDGDTMALHHPQSFHQLQNLYFALTGEELSH